MLQPPPSLFPRVLCTRVCSEYRPASQVEAAGAALSSDYFLIWGPIQGVSFSRAFPTE